MIELIAKFIINQKKKKADSNRLSLKSPDEDLIPYVFHYDPNTILTKNGELLQTIRITGFSSTSIVSEIVSLRDSVRDAVADNIKDNKVALWFHTMRRKKNIVPKGEFKDSFAQKLNESWVKKNKWDDQYVNELYITVIVEGMDTSVGNFTSFLRSFSFGSTKRLHRDFLSEAHNKLSQIVNGIVDQVESYGAKILGINEWDNVIYSEPMRFFGKIVNLYEERYPLSANDISSEMSTHKVAFGSRELEVVGDDNKNFAAILSLKEYFEISTEALDHILQLPFEFIITQSFDFSKSIKELDHFEYQNYILQVSGDEELRHEIGIADVVDSNQGRTTDFGKLQTTIMVIANNRSDLEKDIKMIIEQFSSFGLVVVREDVFLEHCFWAQLPGNFRYLRRQKLINTQNVGGFSALHNYPSGQISGNKWGSAITVLRSVLNTPYFFNFHTYDQGHTLILGPENSGKTTLLNFLLAQSRKINNKIFYFDSGSKSQSFIRVMNGNYYSANSDLEGGKKALNLNPLALEKTEENKRFLSNFIKDITDLSLDKSKKNIFETELQSVDQIVDKIFSLETKNFLEAIEEFKTLKTQNIYAELKLFAKENAKNIFGQESEIDISADITAFNLDEIADSKTLSILTVSYLLGRIENSLDNSPAIIVFKDAWNLLDSGFFAARIEGILQRLKEKNALVIFCESDAEKIAASPISPLIKNALATQILMPNREPHECYKSLLELDDEGLKIVSIMNVLQNHFLVRNNEDSIIFSLNIDAVEFEKILSADETTLIATNEIIEEAKQQSENSQSDESWISQLLEVLREIEKQNIEEEKERIKQERAAQRRRLKEKMGEI
jgi:type IV secretion system protein VirB4